MFTAIIYALALTLVAGFINGSFATPTKYMNLWSEEVKWFAFSFFGMLILPWLTAWILLPNSITIIYQIPSHALITIILGGLLFGLGQICFAVAFRLIGIGLNFVINISFGTACTALVGLAMHPELLNSSYALMQIFGVTLFVLAVIFGACAGAVRDRAKTQKSEKKSRIIVFTGVVLSLLAGIGSACQGVSYTLANPYISKMAIEGSATLGMNTIGWVILFSFAFIPYVLYFLFLALKNKSLNTITSSGSAKYWLYLLIMGIGFWGSLVLFSGANIIIGGDLGPTVAWPLFMVFIILTSNFWSFISGEWTGASAFSQKLLWISLTMLMIAIVVFSASAVFKPY